jgi:hypothetical protein
VCFLVIYFPSFNSLNKLDQMSRTCYREEEEGVLSGLGPNTILFPTIRGKKEIMVWIS